jgi:hypothetical protein
LIWGNAKGWLIEMITSQDQSMIEAWGRRFPEPFTITFYDLKTPTSAAIGSFVTALKEYLPQLKVKSERESDQPLPGVAVGENLLFHMVPEGTKLRPFLDALGQLSLPATVDDGTISERLAALEMPVRLRVFIAPQCPHCPHTVRSLVPLARHSENVHLRIIDAELFSDLAATATVRSVPTIILDGDYRWTGMPPLAEMLALAQDRDPVGLGPQSLRDMIEAGRAPQLAQMMTDRHQVFPAIADVLTHPRWSVRLGAMVVFEYLSESAPDLTQSLADLLWQRFETVDEGVQGDVLYLIGEAELHSFKPRLQRLLANTPPANVAEAAQEALEKLGMD